ncbi:MAG: hypothetical protein DRP63_05515 [Planctomycetota bacterium]|nr:MAG: hypothetical protein DRP63_05515 [Planctomycetota bacterium]
MGTEEAKLYNEGVERYPASRVVWQNLFFVVWFGVGVVGMLPLQVLGFPIVSVLYALFLVITLLFVVRKHLCTHCYYYGRMCSTGWGRLSAAMFKKDSGSYRFGVRFAGITWMFATVTPIIGTIVALVIDYSLLSLLFLIVFILLTPINIISHRNDCRKCKMRFICPASMAKGDSGKEAEECDAEE